MFVTEEGIKINATRDQSLIHATHRTQDLVPAFLWAILNTPEHSAYLLKKEPPMYANDHDDAIWWESDDCMFMLEELFDILNRYAPAGYYFGATEGDSSDYGYWAIENYEPSDIQFGMHLD